MNERLIISALVSGEGVCLDCDSRAALESKFRAELQRVLTESHPRLKVEQVIVEDELLATATGSTDEDEREVAMEFDGSIAPD